VSQVLIGLRVSNPSSSGFTCFFFVGFQKVSIFDLISFFLEFDLDLDLDFFFFFSGSRLLFAWIGFI